MENIQKWLDNGSDYQSGVELYKNLKGCNKMLLRQFMRNETNQRREKLIYELKKHLTINVKLPAAKKIPVAKNTVLITAEKESKRIAPMFHELPSELRPVLLEANNLFKENCLLKVELNELPIDAEEKALSIIIKIDRNFKSNQLCWDKIDYWRKYKQLPKSTAVDQISQWTMDQLIKKQSLLNSSVSRLEKRLKENIAKIDKEEISKEKSRLQRLITKQEKQIISQREELLTIKTQIDVKGFYN